MDPSLFANERGVGQNECQPPSRIPQLEFAQQEFGGLVEQLRSGDKVTGHGFLKADQSHHSVDFSAHFAAAAAENGAGPPPAAQTVAGSVFQRFRQGGDNDREPVVRTIAQVKQDHHGQAPSLITAQPGVIDAGSVRQVSEETGQAVTVGVQFLGQRE